MIVSTDTLPQSARHTLADLVEISGCRSGVPIRICCLDSATHADLLPLHAAGLARMFPASEDSITIDDMDCAHEVGGVDCHLVEVLAPAFLQPWL